MSKLWIKLWTEALSDPKVARLSDRDYRRWTEVLLLAGYRDEEGLLPEISDICWMLHTDEDEVMRSLEFLRSANLLHKTDDGAWVVTNFEKRQETDAAKRMRRLRERNKDHSANDVTRNSDGNSYGNSYGTDSTSTSTSTSLIKNNINSDSEVFALYEAEVGTITKAISEKLVEAWDEYPHEWFPVAFDEAARNNVRNWAYINAILKNWKAHGFRNKNGKPKSRASPGSPPTEYTAEAKKQAAQEEYRRQLAKLEASENDNSNSVAH